MMDEVDWYWNFSWFHANMALENKLEYDLKSTLHIVL